MNKENLRESFEDFIEGIDDPRVERNKLHSIAEILFLTLVAIICGAEGWRDIERFGKSKLDFLQKFFSYGHGVPSDDTLRRFFRALDPENFRECFIDWVRDLKIPYHDATKLISIDGKVSRHTFDEHTDPLHMVTAFASEFRLVLAQEKVSDKSNEIKAIPQLLGLIDLKGAIITIDAMGCQREIAQAICDGQADYVLSLKGNQGSLHEDVKTIFANDELLKKLAVEETQTKEANKHGRQEERSCRVISIPDTIKDKHNWPQLKTLVELISKRETKGKSTQESRYYISSLDKNAVKIGTAIRSHWSIENSLHWILDISFRDDDSRIRRGNAPENIAIVKHMALNILQKAKGKRDSIKQLRKAAGWDNNQLLTILSHI